MQIWAVVYYISPGIWQMLAMYNDELTARQQAEILQKTGPNYGYVRIL